MEKPSIHIGQQFTYDDGRLGHRAVTGEVLAIRSNGFLAQFSDRADTTWIEYTAKAWMDHITFEAWDEVS
jgi:hypothetical protein